MTENEEIAWMRGRRSVWVSLLHQCLRELGYDNVESQSSSWVTEREEALAALRMACDQHGDNDWKESLHLSDIIEKHLLRHLDGVSHE